MKTHSTSSTVITENGEVKKFKSTYENNNKAIFIDGYFKSK